MKTTKEYELRAIFIKNHVVEVYIEEGLSGILIDIDTYNVEDWKELDEIRTRDTRDKRKEDPDTNLDWYTPRTEEQKEKDEKREEEIHEKRINNFSHTYKFQPRKEE